MMEDSDRGIRFRERHEMNKQPLRWCRGRVVQLGIRNADGFLILFDVPFPQGSRAGLIEDAGRRRW